MKLQFPSLKLRPLNLVYVRQSWWKILALGFLLAVGISLWPTAYCARAEIRSHTYGGQSSSSTFPGDAMIQIGEAGWFLPVGGMGLGGLRPDSGEFSYRVLSVEFFQGERFQDRQYVNEACNLTAEILSGLNVPKHTETLHICAGNVTPHIRLWAYQQGYQYHSIPSAKELQILLDTALLQHLREDVDLKNVEFETLHEKPALANWLCWQWLKGENINARRALPARERLAKTGWSTYSAWIGHPYAEAKRLLKEKQASGDK